MKFEKITKNIKRSEFTVDGEKFAIQINGKRGSYCIHLMELDGVMWSDFYNRYIYGAETLGEANEKAEKLKSEFIQSMTK